MDAEKIGARLSGCQKLLIGLGEEWKWKRGDAAQEARLREAYANLYELVKNKDYFIITMATDALIFETAPRLPFLWSAHRRNAPSFLRRRMQ